MKISIVLFLLLTLSSCSRENIKKKEDESMKIKYPILEKERTVKNYHGKNVYDDYKFLENIKDKRTAKWLKEESDFFNEYIKKSNKDEIKKRYSNLFDYETVTMPFKKGNHYFYYKNNGKQAHSVLYRTSNFSKKEDLEIVLDPNKFSKDLTSSLSGVYLSKDANLMVYAVSEGGKDSQTYYVKDLKNNILLEDKIENLRFSGISWKSDSSGFYYSKYPQGKTTYNKVYFHKLGNKEDELIYEDKDDKYNSFYTVITKDEKYLILYVWKGTAPENKILIKKEGSKESFKVLFKEKASYSYIGNKDEKFYFITNLNASNNKLIEIDLNNFDGKNFRTIIEEDKNKKIESILLLKDKFVVSYLKDVHSELELFSLDGRLIDKIKLPVIGSASIEGEEDELFISLSSFIHPYIIFNYNFKENKLNKIFEGKIDFNSNDYTVKQVFYESKDKTKIPMYIIHKKDVKLNSNNPTILYGYGGFNISLTPWFSTIRMLWLENGGVYAIANLRGGGEYGEDWHKAGMLDKKQNVFDDFHYAANYLINNNYTSNKKLAIMGGSNGGLLVSAAMTQRPDLYGAVVCQVPLTDMLIYHKLLVGHYWISEYGNAENSKEEFEYLIKYSPYHNVKKVNYPATLVVTGDSDDRVDPAHARKFTALVQEKNTSNNPILMKVNWKSGHGHGQSREQMIENQADIYGFLFKIFNMKINKK